MLCGSIFLTRALPSCDKMSQSLLFYEQKCEKNIFSPFLTLGYSAVSCAWILMSHGRKKCCDWLTSYSQRGTRQLIGMWGLSQMVL